MEELQNLIQKWSESFSAKIDIYDRSLQRRILAIQAALFDENIRPFLDELDRENGKIVSSKANIARANRIEEIFNKFQAAEIDRELRTFAGELLNIGGLSKEYYNILGFDKTQKQLDEALDILRGVIGIDDKNQIVKNGYLWRLGRTDEVRANLRQIVVNGITQGGNYKEFEASIRIFIKGSKQGDLRGAMEQYWRQYAYDTYNQANEIVSGHIAKNLGLDHLVYQGSIIDTTRAFCRTKAGKAFTRSEALLWKDDKDLIDKKTKSTYNPFIERGRYNCRHFINWISKELYDFLKSKEKK